MSSRDLGVIVLVILGVLVLLPLLMMFGGWGMMGPGMMNPGIMGRWGYGSGSWFGPLTIMLLIAGTVLIVRAVARREPKTDDPQTVLKQRLARGEISKEQFDELKQVLQ